jgi:hypothetical protein
VVLAAFVYVLWRYFQVRLWQALICVVVVGEVE